MQYVYSYYIAYANIDQTTRPEYAGTNNYFSLLYYNARHFCNFKMSN